MLQINRNPEHPVVSFALQNWLSYQLTCLQVLDFLKARDTFLPLLVSHLGTSAIMDLMLKLMTQVEGIEMRQNILNVSGYNEGSTASVC